MTVIFPDRNISPAYFKAAPEGSLLVAHHNGEPAIFYTIQGEGPLAGRPAVFVRLAGCNLGGKGVNGAGCEFCDTDFRVDQGRWLTFAEIETLALRAAANKIAPRFEGSVLRTMDNPLYVITGGEPMLQKNLVAFVTWTGWDVQVETNGMYPFAARKSALTVVVSPKLGAAKQYPRLKAGVFDMASCLKFVLEDDDASPYYTVPDYAFEFLEVTERPVYVSPMAVYLREMTAAEGERASIWDATLIDHPRTARNYRYAAEYAMRHGLRLSMQTHLFASVP